MVRNKNSFKVSTLCVFRYVGKCKNGSENEKEDTSITKADIERLKKKAENYINYKNNKKN